MTDFRADTQYDVVVIGAGLYGIAFAAFYLDVHPDCDLIILDKGESLGGVWSAEKHYDTFWSQIGLGMSEFADFPMEKPEKLIHHFPEADHVTAYLEEYCRHHVHNGRSLRDRMTFNCTVKSLEQHSDSSWKVVGEHVGERCGRTSVIRTKQLVVATGINSSPNMPQFHHEDQFDGKIIHQKDFGASGLLRDPNIQHVAVLGGGKSASDMVYASAKAGKSTTWIIRESGSGPAGFVDPKPKGGMYKNSTELGLTRAVLAMSPLHYDKDTWVNWFLHHTRWGRWLVDGFWSVVNKQIYGPFRHIADDTLPGFENLKPSLTKVFWSNDSIAIVQQPDFWPTVSRNVRIHRGDILSLSPHTIHLSTGATIVSDALCCGTGWVPSVPKLFTPRECAQLGLPYLPTAVPSTSFSNAAKPLHDVHNATSPDWSQLDAAADAAVLARYPSLAHPPQYYRKPTTLAPYRLYQLMVPVDDACLTTHSIIFLGVCAAPNAFRGAQVQALWAVAYLDGYLSRVDKDEEKRQGVQLPGYSSMCKDIAALVAFSRRRYLNNGRLGNWLHYDMVAYTDALLRQILGGEDELIYYGGAGGSWWGRWWGKWVRPAYMADLNPARVEIARRLRQWDNEREASTRVIGKANGHSGSQLASEMVGKKEKCA